MFFYTDAMEHTDDQFLNKIVQRFTKLSNILSKVNYYFFEK